MSKGSKSRITDIKKYKDNFPKQKGEIKGFVKNKGKITKKY